MILLRTLVKLLIISEFAGVNVFTSYLKVFKRIDSNIAQYNTWKSVPTKQPVRITIDPNPNPNSRPIIIFQFTNVQILHKIDPSITKAKKYDVDELQTATRPDKSW